MARKAPDYTIHYMGNNLHNEVDTWMDVCLTDYSSGKPIKEKREKKTADQTVLVEYMFL